MTANVCHSCLKTVATRYDIFERRIEFRDLTKAQGRHATFTTGRVCRECMDAELVKARKKAADWVQLQLPDAGTITTPGLLP